MIRRPPRSTLLSLHDALPISLARWPVRRAWRRKRRQLIRPRHGSISQRRKPTPTATTRSEEHTSELQSRLHLVCRLLLEKKKSTSTPRSTATLHAPHITTSQL